jgi:hypothetical protein
MGVFDRAAGEPPGVLDDSPWGYHPPGQARGQTLGYSAAYEATSAD